MVANAAPAVENTVENTVGLDAMAAGRFGRVVLLDVGAAVVFWGVGISAAIAIIRGASGFGGCRDLGIRLVPSHCVGACAR